MKIVSGMRVESFICSFCILRAHGTLLRVSTVLHQFICSFLFLLASGTCLQASTVQINSSVLYSISCRIDKPARIHLFLLFMNSSRRISTYGLVGTLGPWTW
jgi:hypothetical protein